MSFLWLFLGCFFAVIFIYLTAKVVLASWYSKEFALSAIALVVISDCISLFATIFFFYQFYGTTKLPL